MRVSISPEILSSNSSSLTKTKYSYCTSEVLITLVKCRFLNHY